MASPKKKVLVVDDDYASRRILENILRVQLNCKVLQAEEGSIALQTMHKEKPDLVVLDLVMPFMNGISVLKTMRQTASLKQIPVVVCTSRGEERVVKRVLQYGIKNYMVKPINLENAVEQLSKALATDNDE